MKTVRRRTSLFGFPSNYFDASHSFDVGFTSVMFVDESPDAEVRIIDFGLSQKFAANEHLHDAVGTVYVLVCSNCHFGA